MKNYGLIIMRAQPFHIGHQQIINEILLDGRVPIIVYGSSNDNRDMNKNPLTAEQRSILVDKVYPYTYIQSVKSNDHDDWSVWFVELLQNIVDTLNYLPLSELKDNIVVYHTNKDVDRGTFEAFGKTYENTWYTDIFKDQGFELKHSTFNEHPDLQINANARDIRRHLEDNKHLLDARVYHQLKAWGWK